MESRPKRRKGHSLYNNNNRLDFLLFFSPLQKKKQKSKRKERVRPHPRLPACSFFVISTTITPPTTTTTPQPTTTTLPPTTSLPSLWLNICLRLVLPPSGYPTHQPTSNYNILSSCFLILFFFMLLFCFFILLLFVSSSRSPLLLSYVLLSARLFALARDLLFPRPVFLESTFCKLAIVEINLTNCCLDESPYAPLYSKEKKKDCQHLHTFNWLGYTRWYN